MMLKERILLMNESVTGCGDFKGYLYGGLLLFEPRIGGVIACLLSVAQ